ncbi:MAG: acetyl-CoA carboxylase carboxyltransferase subunit alpha [Coxiellaceae bacterium]|jgi:acetyl-CoA carboxylase carboxyl transferase subunit alpha|nr:acetyl-CoA carboxylase carboxyltransferase subunit alpha [Coxiellaceae bacterium]
MNLDFLDFEQPIAELLAKIEELRYVSTDNKINISQEIARLEAKSRELTKSIFSTLTAMQIVKLARHPQRPHTLDYIERIFTDFDELFGDRYFAKGTAIVGGIARLNEQSVMIIGQQKGHTTKENLERNFGMPNPEEYRKALRLMELAEKFQLPIFSFIDTPGAYPGVGAEERNQSGAIARNLFVLTKLRTPIICTVIGEGGSGGALALGVGDKVIMLQYSIYATISPEGCASILWRSQDMVAEAAEALHLTADKLFKLKLIDQIVTEPLGGAHRDYDIVAKNLKQILISNLNQLRKLPLEKLIRNRYEKIMNFGR